ncbi:hypothetical protein 278BB001_106 [Bacillus phage 278BB001]|nr:hypothetical protein 278BB001_106 [Bacillus phage 278BB001]
MTTFKVKPSLDIYLNEPLIGGYTVIAAKGKVYTAEENVNQFTVYGERNRQIPVSWSYLGEDGLFNIVEEEF